MEKANIYQNCANVALVVGFVLVFAFAVLIIAFAIMWHPGTPAPAAAGLCLNVGGLCIPFALLLITLYSELEDHADNLRRAARRANIKTA